MKRFARFAVVATMSAVALAALPASADDILFGRATAVDGMHLKIDGKTVRLSGVFAPTLDQSCVEWVDRHQESYPCGVHAKAFMMSLVADRSVACVAAVATGARENSNEVNMRCYVDGTDISEAATRAGWAVTADRTSNRYVTAQEEARSAQRGLWAGQFDLPNVGTPGPSLKKVK